MKSTLRKLIPSIIMVLIAATMAGTSTFAWFSMNNRVTVTGMQVTTKVSSNLLIAEDDLESTGRKTDNYFTNVITRSIKGLLEPVSTADGLTFFYTTDAKANGEKNQPVGSEAYIQYTAAAASDATTYGDKFSENYGVTKSDALDFTSTVDKAVPYVDYVFQLKASNTTTDTTQYINVTTLNLKYYGSEDTSTAFRVAFFIEDISGETPTVHSSATGIAGVGSSGTFKVTSSANFDNKVVNSTTGYATANYTGLPTLATVAAGTTKYYKVVARMWLEGQDTTCYSEKFMALTDNWELGIELKLQSNQIECKETISKVNSSGDLV